jgi:hypothetical protein
MRDFQALEETMVELSKGDVNLVLARPLAAEIDKLRI